MILQSLVGLVVVKHHSQSEAGHWEFDGEKNTASEQFRNICTVFYYQIQCSTEVTEIRFNNSPLVRLLTTWSDYRGLDCSTHTFGKTHKNTQMHYKFRKQHKRSVKMAVIVTITTNVCKVLLVANTCVSCTLSCF